MELTFHTLTQALADLRSKSPRDEKTANAALEGLEALKEFMADIHRIASAAEKIQLSMARIESHLITKGADR